MTTLTLSPPPARQAHIARIDVLRGVAILAVLTGHILLRFAVHGAELLGLAGVSLFFVISGFCIHLTASKSAGRASTLGSFLREFFRRRFWRIVPPYLLALVAFWGLERRHVLITAEDFWWHFLLLQNLNERTFFSINPSFWSISVEWQFYLLYPLLYLFWRKWGLSRTFAGVAIVSLLGTVGAISVPQWHAPLSTTNLLACWVLGVWLGECWLASKVPQSFSRWAPYCLLPALASFYSFSNTLICFHLSAVGFAGVLARTLSSGAPLNAVERLFTWIGVCSYSLYLWHQPLLGRVLYWLHQAGYPSGHAWDLAGYFLIVSPIVIGWSWIMYRWVEQPSIAVGHWRLRMFPRGDKAA